MSTNVARADEPIGVHEGLTRDATGPLLRVDTALDNLDTTLRSNTEGYEADVKRETFDFALGARTRARVESSAWTNPLLGGRGWGASFRLSHDFKVVQVGLEAAFHRVDSGAVESDPSNGKANSVHRSYVFLGASVARTWRVSKQNTMWLSLSVGRRIWLNKDQPPPPGEADDTVGILGFGFTF